MGRPPPATELAGLTAPRDPSFNEANVSDKPSNIKNLPLLTPEQIANVDARYRARAEAVLGVDDLVQNVVSTLNRSCCSSSASVLLSKSSMYRS